MESRQNWPVSSLSLLLLFNLLFIILVNSVSATDSSFTSVAAYTPPDSYLIDCGSPQDTKLDDGRTFKSDSASRSYLETNEEVQTSVDSISVKAFSVSSSALPLFRSARILTAVSKYTFYITRPGWHWVRFYFHPLPHPVYNLTSAVFSVTTDEFVLLHDFFVKDSSALVFKEYLFNVSSDRFSLLFKPKERSFAFINAIEVVSAPDGLISDSASTVPQGGTLNGLFQHAFEVCYRLNVGGPTITPLNDTLSRTWLPDTPYNVFPQGAQNASIIPSAVKYQQSGATPYIAPNWVYATADEMAESETLQPNFNLTWQMNVDPGFSYLIRMHFCDVVSQALNDLYFNVYINSMMSVSCLDLSSINNALSTAYYTDFVLNASSIRNGSVRVQVGPASGVQSGISNAILNGLEVIKISNSVRSLDGLFGFDGSGGGRRTMKIAAGVGLAMSVTAMLVLAIVCIRWQQRPQDWEKGNSFSSWHLPLRSRQSFFLNSKSSSRTSSIFGSRKSRNTGYSSYFSNQGLGRYFSFSELQNATQNFDEKAVIGVGGFGKVYLGVFEDGTKMAIKRGNPGSEQGINEFQTEIQMLSKLRHRHLVSLVGFSDEQSEMILVYEYMANGPLRDHIYGSKKKPLSWKQRLEICIGAARALPREQVNLAEWAMQCRRKGVLDKIIDPHIAASINEESLKTYVEAAEKCLAEHGVDRPGMGDVLWNLEYALQLQETSSQTQTDLPGDKNTSDHIIAFEKPTGRVRGEDTGVSAGDDSQVTVTSPLFSQIGNFQGSNQQVARTLLQICFQDSETYNQKLQLACGKFLGEMM
ncbi:hypothetical protein SADUNF_Sadunf15G0054400 [Salix dunnii]|uniref:Protein kinase domain-containing protein n=1 Tax=Salix dunnii TaxID=1413687 RepID=A0A835JIF3_9ROSI|nr:hypothetical protein SADUNF_Sadunf15G0054400 [Salix dunnii]